MPVPLPHPRINERAWELERDGVQRNLDVLALALLDTGGRQTKMRYGSSTATWSAAVLSGAVTVPHGLGAAPVAVFTQTQSQLFGFKVTADATNLTVTGFCTDNTNRTGTIGFYWLAIG